MAAQRYSSSFSSVMAFNRFTLFVPRKPALRRPHSVLWLTEDSEMAKVLKGRFVDLGVARHPSRSSTAAPKSSSPNLLAWRQRRRSCFLFVVIGARVGGCSALAKRQSGADRVLTRLDSAWLALTMMTTGPRVARATSGRVGGWWLVLMARCSNLLLCVPTYSFVVVAVP